MTLGSSLKSRDEQYLVKYDEITKIWRILDTWHSELALLDVEEDVKDDHPAVTILTEGQFISLIKEASGVGILEGALGAQSSETVEEAEGITEENSNLKNQLAESGKAFSELEIRYNVEKETVVRKTVEMDTLKESLVSKDKELLRSESYAIKSKALEAVLRLAISSDIDKVLRDGGSNEN